MIPVIAEAAEQQHMRSARRRHHIVEEKQTTGNKKDIYVLIIIIVITICPFLSVQYVQYSSVNEQSAMWEKSIAKLLTPSLPHPARYGLNLGRVTSSLLTQVCHLRLRFSHSSFIHWLHYRTKHIDPLMTNTIWWTTDTPLT